MRIPRRAAARAISLIGIFSLLMASATGCGVPFVPIEPNRLPLWMRIDDGDAQFLWCGDTTRVYDYLLIEYIVYSDPRQNGVAAEGSGSYELQRGDQFSTAEPPPDVHYSVSGKLPSSQESARIFVSAGAASDDITWSATFEPDTLDDFADRRWLGTSGGREATPCATSLSGEG